ncbi:5'-nucleotidase C-terminal domain-containing protein [Parasediminibacterium sp. JCM 36343]|uniref:5'-nucleotidase C-terminal domain-containing protein n=1 Tax=Parasediminibacterium sp. JCM 36343 TaxID=3374279 RepID=UPI0039785847
MLQNMYLPSLTLNCFMRTTALTLLLLVCFAPPVAKSQAMSVAYSGYHIHGGTKKDSSMVAMLAKYKDSVGKAMNTIVGFSVHGLYKKQPESVLGNFMADAVKTIGEQVFKQPIDAAFINYGGVRGYIPKGDITIGQMFELMPFDNILVLQKIKGDSLLSFLDHVADKNGWPISGITMNIREKKAVDILVGGKPLSLDSSYTIANADYIVNGGDDTNMLKIFPKISNGYLVRDALISYVKLLTDLGRPIDAKIEKRITYADN